MVHNHPAGNLSRRSTVVSITGDLISAVKILSVELLNHLVIGSGDRYVNQKDKRLGFDCVDGMSCELRIQFRSRNRLSSRAWEGISQIQN